MKRPTTNTSGTILSLYVLPVDKVVTSPGCLNKTLPVLPQNGPTHRYAPQQSPWHYYANSANQAAPPTSNKPFHLPAVNTGSTSQPFRTLKAPPAIITGTRFCHAYNQTGRCTAGCPEESYCCNRAGCGEPHPGSSRHAQKSCSNETLLREHFVPLPMNIQTPVNTDLLLWNWKATPFLRLLST